MLKGSGSGKGLPTIIISLFQEIRSLKIITYNKIIKIKTSEVFIISTENNPQCFKKSL